MDGRPRLSRRAVLRAAALNVGALAIAACAPSSATATPPPAAPTAPPPPPRGAGGPPPTPVGATPPGAPSSTAPQASQPAATQPAATQPAATQAAATGGGPAASAFTGLTTRTDAKWLYVESDGMPDHQMMVGIKSWQQQVPLPQPYTGGNAWQVPLAPVRADQAISGKTGLFRGAIALAVNGVPIFNALNNRGDDAYLAGELDDWGGHSGKADDYHYHVAPIHLQTSPDRPIAYALDGYALYGLTEADGSAVQGLDDLNGHAHGGGAYHYHATRTYPYINGGMRGVVTIKEEQIDPQALAAAVRPPYEPLRGAVITGFRATGAKSWALEHSSGGAASSVRYRIEGDSYIFEYVDASGAVRTETYRAPGQGAPASQAPQQTAQATKAPSTSGFVLTSAGVTSGLLAADHTCDGTSSSPPLAWSGAPAGTQSFALVLWHEAGAGDLHWYWTLYNIPASVTSLPKNVSGVGTFGGNSVNPQAAYAAPCSKGPGLKTYRFTLYALSDPPKLSGLPTSDSASVTRDSLLQAIEGRTLGSTELTVQYERK